MNRASYNNPQFTAFQSGSTLCYPSKDYEGLNGGGSLISTKPGKDYFKTPDYKASGSSLKSLMGKSYATSAGGAKKKVSRKKKGGSEENNIVGEEMMMGGKKTRKTSKSKKMTT